VIDVDAALGRMGGARSLYLRMVKEFASQLPSCASTWRSRLDVDRLQAAAQMHTLKGTAATLGATQLADEASRLEYLCKSETPVAELLREASALDALALQTQAAFARLLEQMLAG
jgi:HPt (histidine-containing phosphotransfer) domain-containing protein